MKVVKDNGEVSYRSTTYDDRDAFGVLGGRARVEAAALIAKKYPEAKMPYTELDLYKLKEK